MDFKKMLQQQLGQQDGEGQSQSNDNQRRENQLKTINARNPVMLARILPLGPDTWFAKPFETVFIDYKNQNNEVKQIPVILDSNNPKDTLAKLVHKIIHINYENRQETGNNAPDLITLNTKNSKFHFSIKHQAEVVGIPIVKRRDGSLGMAQRQDGTYYIKNYIIPWSSYQAILSIMADQTQTLQNGQPFDSMPGLGFLTDKDTFPVGIKYNKADKKYLTLLRGQLQLPPITYDYLKKGKDGNYVEFDNPEVFDAPLVETNPNFYNTVLSQSIASYKAQKASLEQGNQAPMTSVAPTAPVVPTAPVTTPTSKVAAPTVSDVKTNVSSPVMDEDPFADVTDEPQDVKTNATPVKEVNPKTDNPLEVDTDDLTSELNDDNFDIAGGLDLNDLDDINKLLKD